MIEPDSSGLDALVRSAAPVRCDAADEQRIFGDAWTRVQLAMDDATSADDLSRRRLDLIVDRDFAARRDKFASHGNTSLVTIQSDRLSYRPCLYFLS